MLSLRLQPLLALVFLTALSACSTAPKASNRASFLRAAENTKLDFIEKVSGLEEQIASSAGVIVFPGIGEWGSIFGGGRFGRAVFSRPDGEQVGWALLQSGSVGLGAGIRRFQMLVVLRDEEAVESFRNRRLTGDVTAAAVVGNVGGSTAAVFENGVAVYQSAGTGLLVGARLSLDLLLYEPYEED